MTLPLAGSNSQAGSTKSFVPEPDFGGVRWGEGHFGGFVAPMTTFLT